MSCTKHFLNLEWEQHKWRPRVVDAEILAAEEADMWGKPVFRDYVRCDKQEICEGCGAVRHQKSCVCEPGKAEKCAAYLEWRAEQGPAPK